MSRFERGTIYSGVEGSIMREGICFIANRRILLNMLLGAA
jgi:hypothetical protein